MHCNYIINILSDIVINKLTRDEWNSLDRKLFYYGIKTEDWVCCKHVSLILNNILNNHFLDEENFMIEYKYTYGHYSYLYNCISQLKKSGLLSKIQRKYFQLEHRMNKISNQKEIDFMKMLDSEMISTDKMKELLMDLKK